MSILLVNIDLMSKGHSFYSIIKNLIDLFAVYSPFKFYLNLNHNPIWHKEPYKDPEAYKELYQELYREPYKQLFKEYKELYKELYKHLYKELHKEPYKEPY